MIPRPQRLQTWIQVGLCFCVSFIALGSARAEVSKENAPKECSDGASAPTAETLLSRYEALENLLASVRGRIAEIPRKMFDEFKLDKFTSLHGKYEVELGHLLDGIFAETLDPRIAKQMRTLELRVQAELEEVMVWVKRSRPLPWDEIAESPELIMPGRVYSFKTERENETIRVRFHKTLVEEFYWETRDSGRSKAAHQSLVGVHRGIRPATSSAAGGIEFYKVVDGIHVVKIQIVGRETGGNRVYGCLKDGVFEFVLWEHEGLHDDRYQRRVSQHTADLCNAL